MKLASVKVFFIDFDGSLGDGCVAVTSTDVTWSGPSSTGLGFPGYVASSVSAILPSPKRAGWIVSYNWKCKYGKNDVSGWDPRFAPVWDVVVKKLQASVCGCFTLFSGGWTAAQLRTAVLGSSSVVVFPSVTATNYIRDSVPSILLNNSSCNCVCYLNGNEMSVRHDRAVFVTVCVQLLSGVSAARSS